jgi:hypothetical protein
VNATRTARRLSLLIFGVACSKGVPAETADAIAPAIASAPSGVSANPIADMALDSAGAMATMKLLDPGRPPRRRLRYTWHPGRPEVLSMDLRTSASTEESGTKQPEIQLPPVQIVLAIDPRSVSPEGDLTYAWQVTSSSVGTTGQTPSSVTDGMRAEVAVVERLSGTAVVTPRGLARRVSIDPASLTDAGATGQMVEQVRQTLRDVAAPFPEEEVGRGARWEKLSQLASRDARVTQAETFTFVDLAGDTGSLDDVLTQTAPPQPLLGPGGAGGEQARIESMLASGDGKTQFDLSRIVPQTKFDGTTTMVLSGQSRADDTRKMTMIMRVAIVLGGAVR